MNQDSATDLDPLTNQFTSLNDLAPELASLQDLANRGSWRSILDKVARARSLSLLSKPHDHLTYLSYNVLALAKLRRFPDASTELNSLEDLDSPEYRYESYPQIYPNRSGSMVPFSLRWLHAMIPIKLDKRLEGMDRLYILLDFVRTKIKEREDGNLEASLEVWRRREVFVMSFIVGQHLNVKEFGVCLDLIRDLINRGCLDPVLISKLGYIQMQIGDLEGAKGSFNKVETMLKEDKTNKSLSEVEECIERDHTDAVAINNKALYLMYLRDLPNSIKVLENALERVPMMALNETLVVNLCNMYEL